VPRPRILVSCSYNSDEAATRTLVGYCDPVAAAGGLPLVAPLLGEPHLVDEALDTVSGVLLIGGPDYHPDAYGGRPQPAQQLMDRRRHDADLLLARATLRRDLPVLGICGGLQCLVIATGGALVQDLPSDWPQAVPHQDARHAIACVPGSRLAALVGDGAVNSFHHQAADPQRLGGWRATAHAGDGVIEGIEGDGRFRIGVQWHPERMPDSEASRALFAALVTAAR
jgi:putative glutamine amidotransferase